VPVTLKLAYCNHPNSFERMHNFCASDYTMDIVHHYEAIQISPLLEWWFQVETSSVP